MVDANRRRLTVGKADPSALLSSKDRNNTLSQDLIEKFGDVHCIHSVTDAELKRKRSFAEKSRAGCREKEVLSEADNGSGPLKPPTEFMDIACRKGLKPESPNQDSFVVVHKPGAWSLLGVFDGHGPNGHHVSDFAVRELVSRFFEIESFATDAGAAFRKCFVDCQKEIEAQDKRDLDAATSGTTCTMAFHNLENDTLTLGHVGDSRGVLYSGDVPGTVVHECEDHKPNLPAEKARIEANGGRVVFDGYYNHRVFAKAGMYPGLNMSRALGDITAHKEAGLTAEPEVTTLKLAEHRGKQLTLLLCSDGVWEFIESKKALKVLQDLEGPVDKAKLEEGVQKLAKKSWDCWMEDSDNEISDDITAIAIIL